jgi:hypothetical protein
MAAITLVLIIKHGIPELLVAELARTSLAMPSPFPGMDPYLEKPSRLPGVHH